MPTSEDQKLRGSESPAPLRGGNLPIVGEEEAPPEVAQLYARFREAFGRPQVPGILQCFATHPPLLEHMIGLAQVMIFTEGALGRLHKEMIATAVSSRNRCAYCTDSHGFSLRAHGGSPELLAATMNCDLASHHLLPAQQALIGFVQRLSDDSASITPEEIGTLQAAGWNHLQIAEAIHITALFACFNRVVNGFGLPSQNLLAAYDSPPEQAGERGSA